MTKAIMTKDPDPFEEGERAARENIPAEANPYPDGSERACAVGRRPRKGRRRR